MNLVMPGGTGFYDLVVVQSPANITDATKQISLIETESLGINATIGSTIQVTRDVFDANSNQGCYFIMASPVGFRFANQETFTNDSSQFTADRNWSFQASCVEGVAFNPATPPQNPSSWPFKAIEWSTLSVTLQYQTLSGGGYLQTPQVRNSPYQTFQYSGTITPLFFTVGDETITSISALPGFGSGSSGTQFQITITDNSIWYLFSSSTITFNMGVYINYQVIPDGEPMPPNPPSFQYIFLSDAQQLNPPIENLQVGFEYQYYITNSNGQSINALISTTTFNGIIRIAKLPNALIGTSSQSTVLSYYQTYLNSIPISGEPSPIQWTNNYNDEELGYIFEYNAMNMQGSSTTSPLLFALPPLLISQLTSSSTSSYSLLTQSFLTNRGTLTYLFTSSNSFQFIINPPIDEYYNSSIKIIQGVNQLTLNDINTLIGQLEYDLQYTNVTTYYDSYNGGKELLCIAEISLFLSKTFSDQGNYTTSEIYNIISDGLDRVKFSMTKWMNETSFVYDSSWGGMVDSWGLINMDQDYSNIMYQDHNFHYGYFVQAAAVIAYLDSVYLPSGNIAWVNLPARNNGTMKDLINCLIRDVTNPSYNDPSFPPWRSVDWEEGHSRPMGIFPTGSGGNEESTAEDCNFYYGMMMWGKYIGDTQTYNIGKIFTARISLAAKYYWQVGSSLTIYEGSQTATPFEPPAGVNNFPAVGILWDDKADPNTWFLGTDYCEVGIQSIARFPYLISSLEDPQWETRMVNYWISPQAFSSEDWHIWSIPTNQSNWYSILLPLLASQYPSGARIVWNDPRCGFDTGNTRGTILWSILYNQAAGPIVEGPYPTLANVSTGYPPPVGYAEEVLQKYDTLVGPEGPIVAYEGDLNDTATYNQSISVIKTNSAEMGLDPRDYPTPQAWTNQSEKYLQEYDTFNLAYDTEVNATEDLPPNEQLSSWQQFATEWGLPANGSVAEIQDECTEVLSVLNDNANLCVQNANAMNAIVERVSLTSCLELLNLLANELLTLSNQKNPPPNFLELAMWSINVLSDPDFPKEYPGLAYNDAGKSCVENFCDYSGIPTPPKYQIPPYYNTTIAYGT